METNQTDCVLAIFQATRSGIKKLKLNEMTLTISELLDIKGAPGLGGSCMVKRGGFKMGYLEDKEKELREALRLNPNNVELHNKLGYVLYHLNRNEEAEDEYREAIWLNPNYAEAHSDLGYLLQILKRYDEAEKEFKKASKIGGV